MRPALGGDYGKFIGLPRLDVGEAGKRSGSAPSTEQFDPVRHLNGGRRKWTAIVAAGLPTLPRPSPRGARRLRLASVRPCWSGGRHRSAERRRASGRMNRLPSTITPPGRSWRLLLSADGARTARLP